MYSTNLEKMNMGDDQICLSSSSLLKKVGRVIVLNSFFINSSAETGWP